MDRVTFGGSSGFMFVTKNNGLSVTTTSASVSVPSQRNCSLVRSASSAEMSRQSPSWQLQDQRRHSGTQIKLVIADAKVSKPIETGVQFVQANASKPFCATPLTNSVKILPGGEFVTKNTGGLESVGRVIAPAAASQGSARTSTQAVAVIPVNFAKSPQKMTSGNNIMVSLVSKNNDLSTWSATNNASVLPGSSSAIAAKSVPASFSPNKLYVFNSNQLPILQQQPKSGVSNQQRISGGQQLVSGTFAAVQGSGTQFVQLVAAPQLHVKSATDTVQAMVIPATTTVGKNRSSTSGQSQLIATKSNGSMQTSTTQRLILPATPHVQLTMAGSNLYQTVPSSVGPTVAYIANPQNYTFVQTQPVTQASSTNHRSKTNDFHGSAATISTSHTVSEAPVRSSTTRQWSNTDTAAGPRPRKPCNCTKSQCLKLYCECFANSEFCNDCNCCNCFNNLEHEDERVRAIKSCLERNPSAFHPKIGKGGSVRQHNKGCNCKRSGCLKNYCECYEAKILCSNLCRCVGCRNFEESPDGQTLLQLADAAEVRVQQQTAAETKLSSQILGPPVRPPSESCSGERLPYTFVTLDVIEAVTSCLLSDVEAKEKESLRQDSAQIERNILVEFGRCISQVIQTATRTRPASPSQP